MNILSRSFAFAMVIELCAVQFIVAAQNLTVEADLSDAPRGLIHGKLTLPVSPGPLTLVYPQWIPGEHGPTGPIANLSGLKFTAAGKTLPWRRDLKDMYALHLNVPKGVNSVEAEVEYLGPTGNDPEQPATSSQVAVLNWNLITLFPQGSDASKIIVEPAVRLPPGWKFGCSMESEPTKSSESAIHFKPVTLEMLIDQPVLAAAHFRKFDLTPGQIPQQFLDVGADSEAALAISAKRLQAYQRLPGEYAALFGAQHYERYHFLLTLSDRLGESGLEHHQCSDNRAPNERWSMMTSSPTSPAC